jgi:hypothetical protein
MLAMLADLHGKNNPDLEPVLLEADSLAKQLLSKQFPIHPFFFDFFYL